MTNSLYHSNRDKSSEIHWWFILRDRIIPYFLYQFWLDPDIFHQFLLKGIIPLKYISSIPNINDAASSVLEKEEDFFFITVFMWIDNIRTDNSSGFLTLCISIIPVLTDVDSLILDIGGRYNCRISALGWRSSFVRRVINIPFIRSNCKLRWRQGCGVGVGVFTCLLLH